MLKQFLADTKENNPTLWTAWENFMTQLKENLEATTYTKLVQNSLGASLKESEKQYFEENTKITAQYVYVPLTSVADSLVSVSKSEIDAYIQDHKNDFQVEASRDISYVKFDVKATSKDEAAIKNEVAKFIEDRQEYSRVTKGEVTVAGFRNTTDYTEFFTENGSDLNLTEKIQFQNEFPANIGAMLFAANKGAIANAGR